MSTTTLILLFSVATQTFHLPKGLISALCFTESSHHVDAIHTDDGNGNSVGVCQVKLATAQTLGFKGTEAELMVPETNIHYAAKYLSKQLKRYQGDITKAVPAYNAGSYREGHDGKAKNYRYAQKVFKHWSQRR